MLLVAAVLLNAHALVDSTEPSPSMNLTMFAKWLADLEVSWHDCHTAMASREQQGGCILYAWGWPSLYGSRPTTVTAVFSADATWAQAECGFSACNTACAELLIEKSSVRNCQEGCTFMAREGIDTECAKVRSYTKIDGWAENELMEAMMEETMNAMHMVERAREIVLEEIFEANATHNISSSDALGLPYSFYDVTYFAGSLLAGWKLHTSKFEAGTCLGGRRDTSVLWLLAHSLLRGLSGSIYSFFGDNLGAVIFFCLLVLLLWVTVPLPIAVGPAGEVTLEEGVFLIVTALLPRPYFAALYAFRCFVRFVPDIISYCFSAQPAQHAHPAQALRALPSSVHQQPTLALIRPLHRSSRSGRS